jgi:hypothetical protein
MVETMTEDCMREVRSPKAEFSWDSRSWCVKFWACIVRGDFIIGDFMGDFNLLGVNLLTLCVHAGDAAPVCAAPVCAVAADGCEKGADSDIAIR